MSSRAYFLRLRASMPIAASTTNPPVVGSGTAPIVGSGNPLATAKESSAAISASDTLTSAPPSPWPKFAANALSEMRIAPVYDAFGGHIIADALAVRAGSAGIGKLLADL